MLHSIVLYTSITINPYGLARYKTTRSVYMVYKYDNMITLPQPSTLEVGRYSAHLYRACIF